MTKYIDVKTDEWGRDYNQTTVYCDATGCDMYAVSILPGAVMFGGYVTITEEAGGQFVSRDYCQWCYARSKGFMV